MKKFVLLLVVIGLMLAGCAEATPTPDASNVFDLTEWYWDKYEDSINVHMEMKNISSELVVSNIEYIIYVKDADNNTACTFTDLLDGVSLKPGESKYIDVTETCDKEKSKTIVINYSYDYDWYKP